MTMILIMIMMMIMVIFAMKVIWTISQVSLDESTVPLQDDVNGDVI